jgi:flagellar hook-associated protein 3 FlgL
MISSLTPNYVAFLNGLNAIQQRTQHAATELTTGLKINTVADSPSQLALLYTTRSEISRNTQITTNLNQVKAEVDGGESVLQSSVTLVEHAQSLATQGQTGFANAETRTNIANQLGAVLQQLVGAANTSVGGRYIFSGDSDQTQPYSIDLTQTNPVSAYAGTAATRQIESPDGTQFAASLSAQTIFDNSDATKNVFQAVNSVRNALLNNDQAALTAALPNLQTANTYLNQQLGFYGATQDQVNNGLTLAASQATQLKTNLSNIQDADLTQAIGEFQQGQTSQQAALAAEAKLPRSSLFDYLG